MAASLPLELLLKLNDQASGALNKAKETVGGLNLKAVALGGAAVGAVTAVGAALWDAAKAAGEEELGVQRLATTVKNTGADWNTAQTAIEAYLVAETARAALDDGQGRDSINKLTAATGDYKTALELMPGVMDLAAGAHISMEQATTMVANGLAGKTAAFSKYGIEIQKGADATEILGAIQETYGGQAEAYGNTFAGAQDKMGIALGNLKETVGAAVLPALTSLISTFANLATEAMPYVETAVGYLSATIGAVMPVIVSAIQTAIGLIIPILDGLVKFIKDPGETIFNELSGIVSSVFTTIKDTVERILNGIKDFWSGHGTEVKNIASGAFNGIKDVIDGIMTVIGGVISTAQGLISGDWQKAWDGVKTIASTVWDGIKGVISLALTGAGGLASVMAGAWNSIWTKLNADWNTMTTTIGNAAASWVGKITAPVGQIWNNIFGPDGAFTKMRDKFGNMFDGIHIKTPHIEVTYRDAGILGRIPTGLDIQWYGRGADFIARGPMLIGVGESGAERVTVQPIGRGSSGAPSKQYVLNYTAIRNQPGLRDAAAAMRELELAARLGA